MGEPVEELRRDVRPTLGTRGLGDEVIGTPPNTLGRRVAKYEGGIAVLKRRALAQDVPGQRPEHPPDAVEHLARVVELQAQPFVDILVEVLQQCLARLVHPLPDRLVHRLLQQAEPLGDLLGRAALLVDTEHARFEVDAALDLSEHVVGRAEHAIEEAELFAQQLHDAAVRLVALVEEIEHHHVVLLPVSMAATDALLDALWVPRQVVVHNQRAELQVDALGGRLGRHHHLGAVTEVLDERRPHVDVSRACGAARLAVLREPALVDAARLRPRVCAAEGDDLPRVPVPVEELREVLLGATGLGEDHRLPRRAGPRHVLESGLQRGEQRPRLRVLANAPRPLDVPVELRDLGFELLPVDRRLLDL